MSYPEAMEDASAPGLGLALGGGTARGMAHVGVLKALEEAGTPPEAVAGTSFGAIIATLYALGSPALEIERTVRQTNVMELWAQALDFGLHEASLIHGRRLAAWLDRKVFFGARLEDARLPLVIAATDVETGELVLLRSGPVSEAVRASCALPGVFAPVPWEGRVLVDGGFVEPVPFRALRTLRPSHMWGVHAGLDVTSAPVLRRLRALERSERGRRMQAWAARVRVHGPWTRLVRGMALSLHSYRHGVHAPEDAFLMTVDPPVAWWDFHRSPAAIEAGERATRSVLARMQVGGRGQTALLAAPGQAG